MHFLIRKIFFETKENEQSVERVHEDNKQDAVKEIDEAPLSSAKTAVASTHSNAPVKHPVLKDVEDLLSEDLTDLYLGLPDDQKLIFKQNGEEVAGKIKTMILLGKIKAKKVFDLIRDWLKIVPGINRFFLEQEVKIKTDKILKYAEEQEKIKVKII